jgi:hypothetical protein
MFFADRSSTKECASTPLPPPQMETIAKFCKESKQVYETKQIFSYKKTIQASTERVLANFLQFYILLQIYNFQASLNHRANACSC